jgi:hypothetical protein
MSLFVGSLPNTFILWNSQNNSFTLYTSEYDGYIGLSRYKLTSKPFDCPEEVSIQVDVSREKFGFTEITGFGHFFFCQTVYCIKERGRPLGQVIAGISSYPIPPCHESLQIRSIFGGDLLDTLYEIQANFNHHPDLPFLMAPLPSAPLAEPLAPSAPSALTPLPAERLCLALARDSIQQKEICPISQEILTPGEIAVTACYCVFQAPLLTMWATTHNTCPACRTLLVYRIVLV